MFKIFMFGGGAGTAAAANDFQFLDATQFLFLDGTQFDFLE